MGGQKEKSETSWKKKTNQNKMKKKNNPLVWKYSIIKKNYNIIFFLVFLNWCYVFSKKVYATALKPRVILSASEVEFKNVIGKKKVSNICHWGNFALFFLFFVGLCTGRPEKKKESSPDDGASRFCFFLCEFSNHPLKNWGAVYNIPVYICSSLKWKNKCLTAFFPGFCCMCLYRCIIFKVLRKEKALKMPYFSKITLQNDEDTEIKWSLLGMDSQVEIYIYIYIYLSVTLLY